MSVRNYVADIWEYREYRAPWFSIPADGPARQWALVSLSCEILRDLPAEVRHMRFLDDVLVGADAEGRVLFTRGLP